MRFAFLFGCGLILTELLFVLILLPSAPPGTRWLGNTMQNASDVAVYLSYLTQGADGHVLLRNLYAVEPHAHRFDVVWSTMGLVARTGSSPLLIHEAARWLFTMILALAIFAAARNTMRSQTEARIASLLAFGGIGAGWLFSFWLGATRRWTLNTYAAADVVTEFSVAPTLLGGAHMILSLALLVTGMRLLWNETSDERAASRERRSRYLLLCVWSLLLSFHPYFIPLYLIACGVVFVWKKISLANHLFLLIPLLPPTMIFAPLAFDPIFRTHHLTVNVLPLAPWPTWIATLFPFLVAIIWRWKKRIPVQASEQWLVAWLIAAVVCILLPLPWKRKYTEGFGVALVFLTMPSWSALWRWASAGSMETRRLVTAGMLLLAAGLTPLHLFASHLVWISRPQTQPWFYRHNSVFAAWEFLRTRTPTSSVMLSDDWWVNVWAPVYTKRTVWVAHDHETPSYVRKREMWRRLFTTEDATEARAILATTAVTHVMTTTRASEKRIQALLNETWVPSFRDGDTVIFTRSNASERFADGIAKSTRTSHD